MTRIQLGRISTSSMIVLLPKKPLTEHLNYLVKKALHKLKPHEILDVTTESLKTFKMMAGIDNMGNDPVTQFIQLFTQQQQHHKIWVPMAWLLYMLSGDAPLSSVVPFRSHPTIHRCIKEVHAGNNSTTLITEMKCYSFELAELFHNSICNISGWCGFCKWQFIDLNPIGLDLIQLNPHLKCINWVTKLMLSIWNNMKP